VTRVPVVRRRKISREGAETAKQDQEDGEAVGIAGSAWLRVMGNDFASDVLKNAVNRAILARWERLDLPGAWLVAGCLFQTVWNVLDGRPPESGIKDYDIFYFDAADLSETAEAHAQALAESVLGDLGVTVEVANQARVHHWYPGYFGRPYAALVSAEEGIGRFLVRETCVGVRPQECCAPFGLLGVYAGSLTPNAAMPYPELFAKKVASYKARWSWLTIEPARSA
jgi:uncharacterized protein